jgi:hypothetical protein
MKIHEIITLHLIQSEVPALSQTKWNKLMFFIDGFSTAWEKIGASLTELTYVKLPYGPVPDGYSEILDTMERDGLIAIAQKNTMYDSSKIIQRGRDKQHPPELGAEEKLVIESILGVFKNWNATRLSNFSHSLDAWKKPEMYNQIDLSDLKNDSYLKKEYHEGNFARFLLQK